MIEKYLYPTDDVTIDLGDGQERKLRYDMGALRRLKKKFGESLITGEAFRVIDEDKLPELLFEGLKDRQGIANVEALADKIVPAAVPYLLSRFFTAFTGAFPESPDPNGQSSQSTE